MRSNKKIIKELTSRVNKTLNYYEKDYISAKRTPDIDKEVCTSFEDYVEIRFNYEAYHIPEIKKAIESGNPILLLISIIDLYINYAPI